MMMNTCEEQQQQSCSNTIKKKVRFSESVSYLPTPVFDTFSSLWFERNEHKSFKQKARMVAQDSREFGYGLLLDDCFVATASGQVSLNRWTRSSRRGLEMWSNMKHGRQRDRERRNSINAVLSAQQQQQQDEQNGEADVLARIYESTSKSARNFAFRMGVADAHAVSEDAKRPERKCSFEQAATVVQYQECDSEELCQESTKGIPGQCLCVVSVVDETATTLTPRDSMEEMPRDSLAKIGCPTAA